MNTIVLQVAHATQDHRLGKLTGTLGIAGAQLAQQRDERVAHQRVDLVQQQDQRLLQLLAPVGQKEFEHGPWGRSGQDLLHQGHRAAVAYQSRAERAILVIRVAIPWSTFSAPGLRRFDVGVDGVVLSGLVQIGGKGQQTGGLACLARGVEQEVLLLRDKRHHVFQVEARQRWQTVVIRAVDRAFGGEKAHRVVSCFPLYLLRDKWQG